MTAQDSKEPGQSAHRRRTVLGTLKALLRTRISAGLITVLPVIVTIWVIQLVFGLIRGSSQRLIEWYLLTPSGRTVLERWDIDLEKLDEITQAREGLGMPTGGDVFLNLMPWYLQWGIATFSVVLTFIVLYTIGLFTANLLGKRIVETIDSAVDRVPMVKTIYRAIKQIVASFGGDQTQNFQRVALIPFPQERMRCVGFITAIFKDSVTGEELATVFIPTTPNPTTGYLQILRRAELVELDWSVEDAVRTIMSGGILRPEFLTIVPTKDMPKHGRPAITQPTTPRELGPGPESPE